MSFLDTLIYGYRTVYAAGVARTQRNKINFGAGLEAIDNPTTGATDVTASGASAASSVPIPMLQIDWPLGEVFTKTLDAGANAFTFANDADGDVIIVEVTGAASTLTWPVGIRWQGGAPPTQSASGVTLYTLAKTSTGTNGTAVDVS